MKIDLDKAIYPFLFKRFRPRRMQRFADLFKPDANTQILDVGGTAFNWSLLAQTPAVTLLNIRAAAASSAPDEHTRLIADGRHLPFAENAFDIVYSNSVIEHLGDYPSQVQFAAECLRVGRAGFIQTPNKWFPVEPHYLTICIHWLPKNWQRRLLRFLSLRGLLASAGPEEFDAMLAEIRLLNATELRALFPGGKLIRERFLGWTKSLIMVYPQTRKQTRNHQDPAAQLK